MHDADALVNQANGLVGDRPEEALALYGRAVRADPRNERGYCGMVAAFKCLKNVDEVVECAKRLNRAFPDRAYTHGVLGRILELARMNEQALACYDRMLELAPGDVAALFRKALLLVDLGREDEAHRCLESIEGEDDDPAFAEIDRITTEKDSAALNASTIHLEPGEVELMRVLDQGRAGA